MARLSVLQHRTQQGCMCGGLLVLVVEDPSSDKREDLTRDEDGGKNLGRPQGGDEGKEGGRRS